MIPAVLHRIWLDEEVPERYERFWAHARELHPGWEFVTWDSSAEVRTWLTNLDTFDRQRTWAGRSDVLRYEILARHGGVYVDTDVEFLRPFDDLLDGAPFAGWEKEYLLCPTVMGSVPGHPAVEALVTALPPWERRNHKRPQNIATGPRFLTRMWGGREDVRLLDREAFYPVGWWERDKLGGPYPAASYAVHHWDQGWNPDAKAMIDRRQTKHSGRPSKKVRTA